ncbi:unnamed protein product [Sphagnum tenellum]
MKTSACDNNTVLNRLRNESHGTRSSLQNLQHSEHAREGDYQQPTIRSQSTGSPAVEGDDHNRKHSATVKTPRSDSRTAECDNDEDTEGRTRNSRISAWRMRCLLTTNVLARCKSDAWIRTQLLQKKAH